jgi:multidrug efflux pump
MNWRDCRAWAIYTSSALAILTVNDVIKAVQEQNVQVAAGIVGGPPLPRGTTPFQYTVNAQGRLVDPKQFGEIIIKTGSDGSLTRIRDVARIELGAADYTTTTHFNGKPAVGIPIFQLPGSNSIATAKVFAMSSKLSSKPSVSLPWLC